jgi:DNA-binding GntR family transcriptional regulator
MHWYPQRSECVSNQTMRIQVQSGPNGGNMMLRSQNRISHTYEKLRELIVSRRLAPGARIIEKTVAERLGVSRTPVRGALQRLQQEGYVVADTGGKQARLTVAPLTKDDGCELFWIIGELEGVAAYWVAQQSAAKRRALVKELRRINEELLAAANESPPNASRIFDLHSLFHQRYVEASQRPRVQSMYSSIKPQVERYRRLYSIARGGDIHESLTEHDVIIHRIEEGDSDGSERAVQTNWRNAADRFAKLIDSIGELGIW